VRQSGRIGSSLQAEATIVAPAVDYEALASLGDDLRFVLITSAATVEAGDALSIAVTPSANPNASAAGTGVPMSAAIRTTRMCGRCIANLFGAGEPRSKA
jgi:isoleucyl-tRNA synthetase